MLGSTFNIWMLKVIKYHRRENRRLMSAALRPARLWVCWLHYFMSIAVMEQERQETLEISISRNKQHQWKPHHSNHFRLNCLLSSQSNPPCVVYLYLCCYPENNAPLFISSGEPFFLNSNQCFPQSQHQIQHPQVPRALGDTHPSSHQRIISRH